MTDITVEVVAQPTIEVQVTPTGAPGMSAYQHAVALGFEGTVEEWLDSLQGTDGQDGAPGADGAPGQDGTDGVDGAPGSNGSPGADGADGEDGAPGASAYEIAVANGFVGDEPAWLASLVGADGADGAPGADGADGEDGAPGAPGADGADGAPGAAGTPGAAGATGPGVASGGSAGQVLKKNSGTNYDTVWGADLSIVAGSANNPHTTKGAARNNALTKNFWQYTGTAPTDNPTNWVAGDEWISA